MVSGTEESLVEIFFFFFLFSLQQHVFGTYKNLKTYQIVRSHQIFNQLIYVYYTTYKG